MSNYKIAFFDLDNTIYDHSTHSWNESSLEAIRQLQNNGVKCFICTARSFNSTKHFGAFNLGIKWDGGVYAAGTTLIINNKVIDTASFRRTEARKFIDLMHSYGVTCEVVGPKSSCYSKKKNEYVSLYRKKYYDQDPRPVKNCLKNQHIPVTCFLAIGPKEIDQVLRKEFPNIYLFRYHEYAVDCKPYEFYKGNGILKALDYYGFKKEEALAFGDDIQDISAAENVGTFIAVGNAREEVKKVATYICGPVSSSGLFDLLKEKKII